MSNLVSRRDFLIAGGVAGSAAALGPPAAHGAPAPGVPVSDGVPTSAGRSPAAIEERVGEPLLNRARATEIMRRAGLDAILVTLPMNVYYVTGANPVMSRFTQVNMTAALLPADPARPVDYFGGGFEFYAGVADAGLCEGVEPHLTGGSLGDPDSRSSPAFERAGTYEFDAREQHRRALTERAAPFHETVPAALETVLRERLLLRKTLGFDSADARALLEQASPRAALRRADDCLLHIRLVKTARELNYMRTASAANVEAALVTARAARQEGGLRRIRQRFFEEAARRGNVAVYGNVDLVMDERCDGALREGQAFMIDFVSHHAFYQGDYGRTVFLGDPDERIRNAADIGIAAWTEIRGRLRPGLKFSDIRRIGNETVKKLGSSFSYAFNPHTVGLQHWDHPRASLEGKPLDLTLEEGMVLSVDCPLLNAGVNGTTHVEDLLLITSNGSQPIHQTGDDIIVV